MVEMLMDSLHEVVQKHLVSINVADVDEHVDDVLRTTNRWGETVFRYMRMAFDKSQKTRLVVVGAMVAAKTSSFCNLVTPDDMVDLRTHLSCPCRCLMFV